MNVNVRLDAIKARYLGKMPNCTGDVRSDIAYLLELIDARTEAAPGPVPTDEAIIAWEGRTANEPGTVWGREAIEQMHAQLPGSRTDEDEYGNLRLWAPYQMVTMPSSSRMSIGASISDDKRAAIRDGMRELGAPLEDEDPTTPVSMTPLKDPTEDQS